MQRRAVLKVLAAAGLLGLAGASLSRVPGRNPYYAGPVSDHFDGLRFFVPGHATDKRPTDLLRWWLARAGASWPEQYPSPYRAEPPARSNGLQVTLIGHATTLIQVSGVNILTDPVWSERASPLTFAGPKRINPPAIGLDRLPPIDAILITHNHYDHLDVESVAALWAGHRPRIIAPLGNDAIIRDVHPDIVVDTRDWGDSVVLSGNVAVHLAPTYHWSARGIRDRRMALWCAYLIQAPPGAVYLVGDTGYGEGAIFRAVRDRFGPPRVALLPIGAYEPRWFMKPQHVDPDEAVRIMVDCGADQALGIHWGTFRLTDEGVEEPLVALQGALRTHGVASDRFRPLRPGESWVAG